MKTQKKIKETIVYSNGKKQVFNRVFDVDGYVKDVPVYWNVWSIYGTMTLALDSDNNIYYWREYRDGPEKEILNFSAGKHETDLSFEENALKELEEELWVTDCDISYLWESIVGYYDTGIMKYFIAKNCKFWEQKLEEWEVFAMEKCSLQDFTRKIENNEVMCPLTLSCYLLAKNQWKI